MNAVYRTFALVGMMAIIAIASFQPDWALNMGKAGVAMAAAAFICLLVGAGLSFALKSNRHRHLGYSTEHEAPDAETTHTSPT